MRLFFLIFISFTSNWLTAQDSIKIVYHTGVDSRYELNDSIYRGGYVTNETVMYRSKGNKLKSIHLQKEKLFYPFENGFQNNIIEDSLKRVRINQNIAKKKIEPLINHLISLEHTPKYDSTYHINLSVLEIEQLYNINKRKIDKIKAMDSSLAPLDYNEFIIQINKQFLGNPRAVYSSVVENIYITIWIKGKTYKLSQRLINANKCIWAYQITETRLGLKSPFLNVRIWELVPKKMKLTDALLSFRSVENLISLREEQKQYNLFLQWFK